MADPRALRGALSAFARMANRTFGEVGMIDRDIKFTIGMARVEPNALPSYRRVSSSASTCAIRTMPCWMQRASGGEAIAQAEATPCGVVLRRLVDAPSNGFDAGLRACLTAAAAGHDARHMAQLCPSAMISIPCRDGVSHAEHEWAEPAHVAAGAAVLAEVVAELVLEG